MRAMVASVFLPSSHSQTVMTVQEFNFGIGMEEEVVEQFVFVTAAEKPERNLVTATELDTVNSQETVLGILYLIETFFGIKTIFGD